MEWVDRFADEVIARAGRIAPGKVIVCASGLSPSGPIHLGSLREVMMPHLVADEVRRRGYECEHILSWDDYDRFRRVPAGIDPAWAEHIGKPLTSVPAPPGSEHSDWAAHFRAPMEQALAELGIRYRGISQTQMYTSGRYRESIQLAMRDRERIGRMPYRPYCTACGRDLTTITEYEDASARLNYRCECGHAETVSLQQHDSGKLAWKVDWPMRWAFESVCFEPSGVDHQSPESSFAVGTRLVREVFGGEPPIGPMYAFVGIRGMAKMSSSKGEVPTPADALRFMEPALLRWLYARRRPNQAFDIAFDREIQRIYDEWDALPDDDPARRRAVATVDGPLRTTPQPLPYRMLASIADITTGDEAQVERILRDAGASVTAARPRLDCAANWARTQSPTSVRQAPDRELIGSLSDGEREGLRRIVDDLEADWSLEGLTRLVYGVPKQLLGLPADTSPTPELKRAQRAFFALLYRLLVGQDTGPRLPTLLLALGPARVRSLLDEGRSGVKGANFADLPGWQPAGRDSSTAFPPGIRPVS